MSKFEKNFTRFFNAGFPILYVDTFEDYKVTDTIHNLCKKNKRGIIEWSLTGAKDFDIGGNLQEMDLAETLKFLFREGDYLNNKIILLKDAHFFINEPAVISIIKTIAQNTITGKVDCIIVIVAPFDGLPKELESYTTVLELDFLDDDAIKKIIENFAVESEVPIPNKNLLNEFSRNLKGLSRTDIENILALAISDGGGFNAADIPKISAQKKQLIRKSNILEMLEVKESMNDIGGLENLKGWLRRKAEVFQQIGNAQQFGVDIPKGVLIVGMPGCGKSLTAKAVAKSFKVPLLRLDIGRLMGKYVGESETNMRRAIKLTESSAPCVLWIDEIEKAFAGINSDNGSEVTARLFGNFLTWMQEKESLTFVVATANKIDVLPPELLRKGRFDEIFYVGLPNFEERKKILEVHINKRRSQDLQNINLDDIAKKTEGYCGADLEGIIKDAIENVFVSKKDFLSTEDILAASAETHSLSEVMKDSIKKLQEKYTELKLKSAT